MERKLALKLKKKPKKKATKKTKSAKRKLKVNTAKVFEKWLTPEKMGLLSVVAGIGAKRFRTKLHFERVKKLEMFEKNQRELNRHTQTNEDLLKRINEALRRSNHQVQNMKSLVDERMASKVEQLRMF